MKYVQSNNPKRHKLIRDAYLEEGIAPATKAIGSIVDLGKDLQAAILVEHFTIPPYLCALYSIKEGSNEVASRIIRSVVVEEMLHMIMVANIMNAIGLDPIINQKEYYPKYKGPLPLVPAPDYEVSLLKFSKEAINTFLRIERPAPEEDETAASIGRFYAKIRLALRLLEQEAQKDKKTIFTGDPKKQVGPEHYYGSGGKLIAVRSLEDAEAALDEIVGQGEGIDGSLGDGDDQKFEDDVDYAHYFRFNEVFHERFYQVGDTSKTPPTGDPLPVDWDDVYNMQPNPKMAQCANNPWLLEKSRMFNRTYKQLLDNIQAACSGHPDMLLRGLPLMYKLKEQAVELMKIPNGSGNYTAGPTFEYVDDKDPSPTRS